MKFSVATLIAVLAGSADSSTWSTPSAWSTYKASSNSLSPMNSFSTNYGMLGQTNPTQTSTSGGSYGYNFSNYGAQKTPPSPYSKP